MLIQLFILLGFLNANAYVASEQMTLQPQSILQNMRNKKLNIEPSKEDIALKADLKAGRLHLDPYMPEPNLIALKKEIESNEPNLQKAKVLAKALIYQAVEKRWQHDLEYTVLNDISASKFSQFAPSLLEIIQQETRYMGTSYQNGKSFLRFQVADWGFVSIDRTLKDAKLTIEFDSTADDNRVPESVKKLKSRE